MLIVMANKDNDSCQLLNRWIDSIRFSQWQNTLLSVIHLSCSHYILQLPGKKHVLKIRTWQKRVQFHSNLITPHSLQTHCYCLFPSNKLGHPFRWSYFVSKITKSRCMQCFILQSIDFCLRTHSHLQRFMLAVHLHFESDQGTCKSLDAPSYSF